MAGETVQLQPGAWWVIDEEHWSQVVALAYAERVKLDHQSLRPAGDRLN